MKIKWNLLKAAENERKLSESWLKLSEEYIKLEKIKWIKIK